MQDRPKFIPLHFHFVWKTNHYDFHVTDREVKEKVTPFSDTMAGPVGSSFSDM